MVTTMHKNEKSGGRFSFHAEDVTGYHSINATDVERSTPAGAVAQAVAARMSLPLDVPYGLMSDRTGAYLADDEPIGDQVETGSKLMVTPKSHLGASAL